MISTLRVTRSASKRLQKKSQEEKPNRNSPYEQLKVNKPYQRKKKNLKTISTVQENCQINPSNQSEELSDSNNLNNLETNANLNNPNNLELNSTSNNLSDQSKNLLELSESPSEGKQEANQTTAELSLEQAISENGSCDIKMENNDQVTSSVLMETESQSFSETPERVEIFNEEVIFQVPVTESQLQEKTAQNGLVDVEQTKQESQFEENQQNVSSNGHIENLSLKTTDVQIVNEDGNVPFFKFKKYRKRFKKKSSLSNALKKKKLNSKLQKLITPKNALTILNEMQPDWTIDYDHIQMEAHVRHKGKIFAVAKGESKSKCKILAAEIAIRKMITQMTAKKYNQQNEHDEYNLDFSWAGVASFALFKLLSEWQIDGLNLNVAKPPAPPTKEGPRVIVSSANQSQPVKVERKELPTNASEMHPCSLVNLMWPGTTAVELHRDSEPHSSVVVGYKIEGKMFTGRSSNKKDAKREAAKMVLAALYGFTYD